MGFFFIGLATVFFQNKNALALPDICRAFPDHASKFPCYGIFISLLIGAGFWFGMGQRTLKICHLFPRRAKIDAPNFQNNRENW